MSDFIKQNSFREIVAPTVRALRVEDYEADDCARVHLAHARLMFYSGLVDQALQETRDGLASLGTPLPPSGLSLKLYAGLTIMYGSVGELGKAADQSALTYALGMRIGDEQMAARQASNLAMLEFHKHNFVEAIRWAERSRRLSPNGKGFSDVVALAALGLANARQGHFDKAFNAVEEIERFRSSNSVTWISQGALLLCADVLSELGYAARAHSTALEGTTGVFRELHSMRLAALYAYWCSETWQKRTDKASCMRNLRSLKSKVDLLDLIDRVEVLLSLARIVSCASEAASLRSRAIEIADTLPPQAWPAMEQRRFKELHFPD